MIYPSFGALVDLKLTGTVTFHPQNLALFTLQRGLHTVSLAHAREYCGISLTTLSLVFTQRATQIFVFRKESKIIAFPLLARLTLNLSSYRYGFSFLDRLIFMSFNLPHSECEFLFFFFFVVSEFCFATRVRNENNFTNKL